MALGVELLGAVYWYVRAVYLPRRGGYKLETKEVEEDGISRKVLRRVPFNRGVDHDDLPGNAEPSALPRYYSGRES